MLQEFLSTSGLNLVYSAALLISFIFAVLSLIGAEVGDALDFDADFDTDGGVDFINISPFALAMFGAGFGITGLITRIWLDMTAVPSILWASGVGIVVGAAAQALFIYVLSPTKSSHFSLNDDIGREAEVIITIPANGMGQIAYDNVSGRVTLGARSLSGKSIKSGQFVIIERVTGRVAFVRPSDNHS
ncbi:MAG: hypothetical protein D6835_06535 [Candidatus Thermofonsia bacterium]|nr:MAG: hypothetical protein D6835_06535 [Candidatus Thermofonsia bacterium]